MRMVIAAFVALAALTITQPAAAQDERGPDEVYFPETGHYVSDPFLEFWRENGGIHIFGYPLSPEITEDGITVQYFERHVLEHHPDNPEDYQVLLRRLGAEAADARDILGHDAFSEVEQAEGENENLRYFPETGQTLAHDFLDYWENHGALRIFGYPLSDEFEYDGMNVQVFERAFFEYHPDNSAEWRILFERLGAEAADWAGVDTSPVEHDGETSEYYEGLWWTPEPHPADPTGVATPLPGAPDEDGKWMEVDLTNQVFRAWEGEQVVHAAVVSTGRPAVPTLTGTFETWIHLRYDDMRGWTPDRGSYSVPNVPYVMYYDGSYGLHGTYWHNNYGTPQSAGCVNLTVQDAEWVFNWADVGTTIWIHGQTPGT
jgi:hypothetical protein